MQCKLWKGTGFNGINIPDGPSVLEALPSTTHDALDVIQDYGLDSVKLNGAPSDFVNVDYVKVGNFYYKVFDPPYALNASTTVIPLVLDAVTSMGGINNIPFLDGIVRRASSPTDDYGTYCTEDELLTPTEPLQLDIVALRFDETQQDVFGRIYLETTIDLGLMACVDGSVLYTDDGDSSVVVPHSYPKMGNHTAYRLFDGVNHIFGIDTGTTLFITPQTNDGEQVVPEGLQKCRGLGIESAIFNQVFIPSSFAQPTFATQTIGASAGAGGNAWIEFPYEAGTKVRRNIGRYNGFGAQPKNTTTGDQTENKTNEDQTETNITTYSYVSVLEGTKQTLDSGLAFEYTSVNNKRVLYGANNTVGLLTNAGNKLESKPEELLGGGRTTLHINCMADPHPEGSPYYRFEYMNGGYGSDVDFWFNAIRGLKWKKVPLIFNDTSGNILNTLQYNNSRRIADYNYDSSIGALAKENLFNPIADFAAEQRKYYAQGMKSDRMVGAGAGFSYANSWTPGEMLETTLGGLGLGAAIGMAPTVVLPAATGAGKFVYDSNRNYQKYQNAKLQESSAYVAKNSVSSPSIQIGYDHEAFRDFYGEITFVYRYRPTNFDLTRMDRLLTMYGYKMADPINDINLNSRTKFNYLEADVTIGGDSPIWIKELAKAQLSAGVRIWHKKPNYADYNSGNPLR